MHVAPFDGGWCRVPLFSSFMSWCNSLSRTGELNKGEEFWPFSLDWSRFWIACFSPTPSKMPCFFSSCQCQRAPGVLRFYSILPTNVYFVAIDIDTLTLSLELEGYGTWNPTKWSFKQQDILALTLMAVSAFNFQLWVMEMGNLVWNLLLFP